MTRQTFAAGDIMTQTGTPATGVRQIVSGYAKVLKELPNGEQVLLGMYMPGNCYAESAVLARREHHHTTVAATPVVLNTLDGGAFAALYDAHHQIPALLCRKLAEVTALFVENREAASLHNVGERLSLLMINLAQNCGVRQHEGIVVEVPLTITDLALFLGVSRQTAQKEVTALKRRGVLEHRAGHWLIPDPDWLTPGGCC